MNGQLALQKTYNLQDFIAVHFGQSSFNGHVVIGARKKGYTSVYRFRSVEIKKLPEEIASLKFRNMDYFITANSFSSLDRSSEKLFGLENIVIDIDYHKQAISEIQLNNRIDRLLRTIRDKMTEYLPNTVVRTGRGVQLWYSLKPTHKSLAYYYSVLVDNLISKVNDIICQDKELYAYFGCVDAAPSRNMAGYFRLPGSYNSKIGKCGTFEIWHEERLDLRNVGVPESEVKKDNNIIVMPKNKDGYSLAKRRIYQMDILRKVRTAEGKPEQRDLMNFIVYCSCQGAYDEAELRNIVSRFNAGHANPIGEKELWQQLSTASKKKYRITNKWIIDALNITQEEQIQIGINGKVSGREIERRAAREAKRARNEKIISLAYEGRTYKEIADIVGCSERTVSRVVLKAGVKKSWSVLHTQILELFEHGYTKLEVSEMLGVCIRTIERHLNGKVEEAVTAPVKVEREEAYQIKLPICRTFITRKMKVNDKSDKNALIYSFSIGGYG